MSVFLRLIPRSAIAGLRDLHICNFDTYWQTAFQRNSDNLHPQQPEFLIFYNQTFANLIDKSTSPTSLIELCIYITRNLNLLLSC